MQAFDASSMIHAWDHYPEGQFPGLWEWIGDRIESREFAISEVAYKEVEQKAPDCAKWLEEHAVQRLPVTNDALRNALMIKGLLGIENDLYGDGVGENDILIIASAKEHHQELVSNENRQNILPRDMKKYKIPSVCSMPGVAVPCLSFIEVIKRSGVVFR